MKCLFFLFILIILSSCSSTQEEINPSIVQLDIIEASATY